MKTKTNAKTSKTMRRTPELRKKEEARLRRRWRRSVVCSQKGGMSSSSSIILEVLIFAFEFLLKWKKGRAFF